MHRSGHHIVEANRAYLHLLFHAAAIEPRFTAIEIAMHYKALDVEIFYENDATHIH